MNAQKKHRCANERAKNTAARANNWTHVDLRTRNANPRELGMTLIEVMIAATILAFLSIAMWSGFAQTVDAKERTQERLDQNHAMVEAVDRMARELSQAFVSIHVNPNMALVTSQTIFAGDSDRVNFTSFSHQRLFRDAHESDQNELSYFVMRHPEADYDILVRREQVRIDDDPERGGDLQIMLHKVEEFELEYFDSVSNRWVPTWNTQAVTGQPNRLPMQVRIRLVVRHPRTGRQMTLGTRVDLPLHYALNHSVYLR